MVLGFVKGVFGAAGGTLSAAGGIVGGVVGGAVGVVSGGVATVATGDTAKFRQHVTGCAGAAGGAVGGGIGVATGAITAAVTLDGSQLGEHVRGGSCVGGFAGGGAAGAVTGAVAAAATLNPRAVADHVESGATGGGEIGCDLGKDMSSEPILRVVEEAIDVVPKVVHKVLGVHKILRDPSVHIPSFQQSSQRDVSRLSAFLAAHVYDLNRRKEGGILHTEMTVEVNECCVDLLLRDFDPRTPVIEGMITAVYEVRDTRGSPDRSVRKGDLFLSFKGSSTKADWAIPNPHILAGTINALLQALQPFLSPGELKKTYGGGRVFVTGHSLGGSVALAYADHKDNIDQICEMHVFNPGTGAGVVLDWVFDIISPMLGRICSAPKIFVHRVSGDLVSYLTNENCIVRVLEYSRRDGDRYHHEIKNFTTSAMDTMLLF